MHLDQEVIIDEIQDEINYEKILSDQNKRNENIGSFKSNEMKSQATVVKEEYGINFYEQSDEKDLLSAKELLSHEDYIQIDKKS